MRHLGNTYSDLTYRNFTYNINKYNIAFMFLFAVITKDI